MSKCSLKKPSKSIFFNNKKGVNKPTLTPIKQIDIQIQLKEIEKQDTVKSKRPASSASITHALGIMKEIDPNQKLNKNEIISILNKRLETISDINLLEFEAISYLLYRFENLEEKLTELEDFRGKQENKIYAEQTHLSKDHFAQKISLSSDEKLELDESLRILEQSKNYFSANSKYIEPTANQKNTFNTLNALKKINLNKVKELYRV